MKHFTLLSGKEENGIWSVQCVIKSDGTFQRKGGFILQTKEERQKIYQKYNKNHKSEEREYYQNNKIKKLKYQKKYNLEHKNAISERQHNFYLENREEKLKYQKEYNKTHKKENKERAKRYALNHKEQLKIQKKIYYELHRKEILEKSKTYQKTEQGRLVKRKVEYRRKGMGFEIIADFKKNKILSPTQYHHIDNINVIEIPRWLHMKCNNPNQKKHRDLVKGLILPYLNDEYYDIINKEKFEDYKHV